MTCQSCPGPRSRTRRNFPYRFIPLRRTRSTTRATEWCAGKIRASVSDRAGLLAAACVLAALGSLPARAENKDLTDAGDWLQIVIPAAGFLGTIVADDPEGRVQATKSYATTIGVVQIGKASYAKLRPKGTRRNSFPSGHTAGAFMGAAFINTRYGPWWGIPSYALAALTGYSRIQADAHFADDVLAGASVAFLVNYLYVTPMQPGFIIAPTLYEDGAGLTLTVPLGGSDADGAGDGTKDPGWPAEPFEPRVKFTYEFGPAYLNFNEIAAPAATGTAIRLQNLEKRDDPTTTARAILEIYPANRHTVTGSLQPFESRDRGTLTQPVSFAGELFPAGTNVLTAWRMYDARVQYDFEFLPEKRYSLRLGAGLLYQWTNFELRDEAGTRSAEVNDHVFLPYALGRVAYDIADDWSLFSEVAGTSFSSDKLLDISAGVNWQISERWTLSAAYEYSWRDIDTDDLRNKYSYDGVFLSVGLAF